MGVRLPPPAPAARSEALKTTDVLRNSDLRAVLAITFVVMLGFGLVAPALPLFARSFGVSYAAVGLLISGFGLTRLVSQPFGGGLVDRLGERRVAVLGVGIVGGSSFAAGLAPNFPSLLVARSIGGIGSAWFITSLTAYVIGLVPKEEAGRALSVYQGSFTAGITMGPVAGGFLAQHYGLRAPFFAYAAFCSLSGLIAWRVLRGAKRREAGRRVPVLSLRGLPRRPAFLVALLANAVLWWTFGGSRITLVPLYAQAELGASEGWIGMILTVASVCSLLILPHAGRMADRSRFGVLVPGLMASSLAVASLGFIGEQGLFLVVFAAMGAVQGYARVPASALVADVVDEDNRGRAVALHQMAGDLGGILGPAVAGALATGLGFRVAFAAVALPAAATALVAFPLRGLHRRRRR